MKAIGTVIGYILGAILVLIGIVGLFDIALGLLEIAWWFITGDFFHFTSIESTSVF